MRNVFNAYSILPSLSFRAAVRIDHSEIYLATLFTPRKSVEFDG